MAVADQRMHRGMSATDKIRHLVLKRRIGSDAISCGSVRHFNLRKSARLTASNSICRVGGMRDAVVRYHRSDDLSDDRSIRYFCRQYEITVR
jgi:hypothetical protein